MAPLYSGSADEWCYLSTDTLSSAAMSVEFIIDNFESQMQTNTPLKSHKFKVKNTSWHIDVYPDNKNNEKSSGYVGVYIMNDNKTDMKVNCKFEIGKIVSDLHSRSVEADKGLGYSQFLTHEECKKVMNDGKLTVKVELKVLEEESILIHGKRKNFKAVPEINMNMNLKIFEDKTFADFCVLCNEMLIPCHKSFLANSPVLKAMMQSNMKEAKHGTLELNNYTETVAENFVKFFYTGHVDEDVVKESAVSFLDLGEQYDLVGLKDIAEQAMIANLDEENMISFFLAGDLYNGKKIRAAAKTFLGKNRRSLKEQKGWRGALKEKHELVFELLESFSIF